MRSGLKQGVKQTEKSGSHRVFGRFSALKQKMSGKTGWFCYAKKSGCDILDKKMKSKNVSLVLKFIPVRGRKPALPDKFYKTTVEIYPREGTETSARQYHICFLLLKFIPVRGRKLIQIIAFFIQRVEIYPREGTEIWSHRQRRRNRYSLNLTPRGDGNTNQHALDLHSIALKFIPVRGRKLSWPSKVVN